MDLSSLLPVFAIALAAFGIGIAAMAVGRIFTGRCLRGSCGGPAVLAPDGEKIDSCEGCPNRKR